MVDSSSLPSSTFSPRPPRLFTTKMPAMTSRTIAGLRATAVAAAICLRAADAACSSDPLEITYAFSSNRMYVRAGCAQISDIMAARLDGNGKQKGPIWHFDQIPGSNAGHPPPFEQQYVPSHFPARWAQPSLALVDSPRIVLLTSSAFDSAANAYSDVYTGTYYMTASIFIENGATLEIDGRHSGSGDCRTLLLASDATDTESDVIQVRAHGGNLVIRDTKIFSWDISAGDYDRDPDNGRAYVGAVTEIITGRKEDKCKDDPRRGEDGYSTGEAKEDMGVARMDIYDSELAYLGYGASEAYGISYKARGLCKTLSNLDIYDDDQPFDCAVYGDIYRSHLHHNWFGHYSYGHQGGKWYYNTVNDNIGYGFDPHDDSDFVEIVGNEVYNNGNHGIIASKRCTDIIIADNNVYNNAENGIMLHRSSDRAEVYGNTVYENGDSGMALYESSDCQVYRNTFENNRRGIRWSNGANNNRVYNNDIRVSSDATSEHALYLYAGNDERQADGNPDGHPRSNYVIRNDIWSDADDDVLYVKEADDNKFFRNTFHSGNTAKFVRATENKFRKNTFPTDFTYKVDEDTCFKSQSDPFLPNC